MAITTRKRPEDELALEAARKQLAGMNKPKDLSAQAKVNHSNNVMGPSAESQKLAAEMLGNAAKQGLGGLVNENAQKTGIDVTKVTGGNPVSANAPAVQPPATNNASAQQPQAVQPTTVSVQPREISPEVREILDLLKSKVNSAPVSYEDIENSEAFKAMKARNELKRGEAQAQLRRGMSSRNMLRSTPAIQSLAESDAYYTAEEAANTQQMLRDAYARQQQELVNLGNLLNQIEGVENNAFNQGLAEFQATSPYVRETVGQRTAREQFEAAQRGQLPDGSYTLAGREALAGLTGIDPVTGKPTFGQQQEQAKATRQETLDNLLIEQRTTQNQIEALKLEAMQTPDPDAKAKAQLALRELELKNEKLQAEIDETRTQSTANTALANQRNTEAAQPKEPKKTQAELDAEKTRSNFISGIRSDFNVTNMGAEGWADLKETWAPDESGNRPTLLQMQQDLAAVTAGLPDQDKAILTLLFQAEYMGNSEASTALSRKPYSRRATVQEEE